MEKKLQVFVSSTYMDLKNERQAAVEAILKSGHIPAGMELFSAGEEQLQTIYEWIDKSDIYMLILGGRYGTLSEKHTKSYTQLEYEYAVEKKKPIFAVIMSDSELQRRVKEDGVDPSTVLELENSHLYREFKRSVKESRIVYFYDNVDQVKAHVTHQMLSYMRDNEKYAFRGWVTGNHVEELIRELEQLRKRQPQSIAGTPTNIVKSNIVVVDESAFSKVREIKYNIFDQLPIDAVAPNSERYEELRNDLYTRTKLVMWHTIDREDTMQSLSYHLCVNEPKDDIYLYAFTPNSDPLPPYEVRIVLSRGRLRELGVNVNRINELHGWIELLASDFHAEFSHQGSLVETKKVLENEDEVEKFLVKFIGDVGGLLIRWFTEDYRYL